MTQTERILEHVQKYGSITPMEAFGEYGITKLATRISELRREGVEISGEMIEGKNRYGEPIRFMRYRRA